MKPCENFERTTVETAQEPTKPQECPITGGMPCAYYSERRRSS